MSNVATQSVLSCRTQRSQDAGLSLGRYARLLYATTAPRRRTGTAQNSSALLSAQGRAVLGRAQMLAAQPQQGPHRAAQFGRLSDRSLLFCVMASTRD
jgi:hypothetical protein